MGHRPTDAWAVSPPSSRGSLVHHAGCGYGREVARLTASQLTALTVALVALAPARAAPPADVPAQVDDDPAYEAGKQALRRGDWPAAIAAFTTAVTLARSDDERWRAELGLALGHELAGDLLQSTIHYRRFLSASGRAPLPPDSEWGPRRFEAAASIERLERTLVVTHGRLALTTTPAATFALTPDAPRTCATTPCTLFLAPGRYEVALDAPDHAPARYTIDIIAGERTPLSATLSPLVVLAPPVTPPPDANLRPAAIATFAGGGAALVTAAVFWGLAAGDQDALRSLSRQPGTPDVLTAYDRTLDRQGDRETAAWVAATTGVVAIGVGLVIALLD